MSLGPPGGNGNINRIGLEGYGCANVPVGQATTTNDNTTPTILPNCIELSSDDLLVELRARVLDHFGPTRFLFADELTEALGRHGQDFSALVRELLFHVWRIDDTND